MGKTKKKMSVDVISKENVKMKKKKVKKKKIEDTFTLKVKKGKKIHDTFVYKVASVHKISQLKEKLREYSTKDLINQCANCSMCRDECPSYYSREAESFFAGGRLRVLRTILERNYPITDDFIEAMYLCSTCHQCKDICPIDVDFVEIIEDLRAELVKRGVGPYGKLLAFAQNVHKCYNPYGEAAATRKDWVDEGVIEVERGPYGYFAGCTASFRVKSAALNTARILTKILGGIVLLGSDESCCGSPLIRTGQTDFLLEIDSEESVQFRVKDIIDKNIHEIVIRDVKEVIFSCSGCYKTSSDDWPKYFFKEIPFKRTHLSQFLARCVDEGKVKFKELNKKITYHDPCHLGRHRGVYEEPRKVLKAIPGVELIEMRKNRNRSRCCGAGGGVKSGFPQDALKIAMKRVQDAVDTGADILATSCVFCKYNFLDAKKELGVDIEILNIEDIVVDLIE